MLTNTTYAVAVQDDLVIEEFGQTGPGPAARLCLASHIAPAASPADGPAGYAA
ncbi:hypothetical protein ACH4FX_33835 [Streptomyces sp. NPDC018019]|uniref:hypothetical protein n=1 Tax=Streptomyces sp. NPDC018019 TaxID=3365030 RepID=UPI0037878379